MSFKAVHGAAKGIHAVKDSVSVTMHLVWMSVPPPADMAPWPRSSEPQFSDWNVTSDGLCLTGFL